MLIAREKEKKILKDAAEADESQFIAVYGRRRVGKTYLVRETFNNTFFLIQLVYREYILWDLLHYFLRWKINMF